MNKKENLFTTTLRLNLNNAQDMEAWNNLMSTDRNQPDYTSYSRTVVTPSMITSPGRTEWRSNRNGKRRC